MSPDLGEHNDDVLRELGFSAAEADALREGGAFGPVAPAPGPAAAMTGKGDAI